jgi:hypothetical protein
MRIESSSFRLFIMSLMIVVKRALSVLIIVAGLTLVAVGASNQPCPLPASSNESTASAQSPEQPQCMRRVLHNGMRICLPCPAADAHVRVHGDEDLGPCDKPGNETPPGRS